MSPKWARPGPGLSPATTSARSACPLVRGRVLDEHDDADHPRVIVINETMARTYWPNQDAIGKRIQQVGRDGRPGNGPANWITVVGIIGDVRADGLDRPVPPQMYGSLWQFSSLNVGVVMKTRPGVSAEDVLRREVKAVDAELPVYAVRPFDEVLATSNATRRFVMLLVGLFGLAAMLLAALGIYGVIAYAVSQQQREIGIRIALGARPGSVVRMVLADGLRLTLVGVACGVVGALATTRVLAGLLFGVGASDPVTFGGSSRCWHWSRWRRAGFPPAAPRRSARWSRCGPSSVELGRRKKYPLAGLRNSAIAADIAIAAAFCGSSTARVLARTLPLVRRSRRVRHESTKSDSRHLCHCGLVSAGLRQDERHTRYLRQPGRSGARGGPGHHRRVENRRCRREDFRGPRR